MTIDDIRNHTTVLFDCIAGSKAYGLDTGRSDTDIRGVFALPAERLFGLSSVDQVSADNNNVVWFELRRFVELLVKNNPNILELLGIEERFVRTRHPLFSLLQPQLFLSRRCLDTFGRYAFSQIRKARGLNKKILNPMPRERKTVTDFCYVLEGYGSRPLADWLSDHGYSQERCGLVRIPHFRAVLRRRRLPEIPRRYHGRHRRRCGHQRGARGQEAADHPVVQSRRL